MSNSINTNVGAEIALIGSATGAASIAALIAAGGSFLTQFNAVAMAQNTYGSAQNDVNAQVTFNTNTINALNTGLGSLADADPAQESAQLQSLQIKQQEPGTQALTIANQTPRALLSLVKNA